MPSINRMEFVFSDEKARALGVTIQDCYNAVDEVFAQYGIMPKSQGVYEAPDNQNTFNAFGAATWLTSSDWFLKVINAWRVYEDGEWEDCLAVHYKYAKINKR